MTEGSYTYAVANDHATVTGFDKAYAGELSIPSSLGGHPVSMIGNNAFESCTNLTAVAIPNTVTNIGEFAFWRCSKLTSATIPDSVTAIMLAAFCACESLSSISIPDSVTTLEKTAFSNCGLTNLVIGAGVKNIENGAFEWCVRLPSVSIPNTVTNISDLAFSNCRSLAEAIIGTNVVSVGTDAFNGCYNLKRLTIPASVARVGGMAFENCTNLTAVCFQGNAPSGVDGYTFYKVPATLYYLPGATGWEATFGGRPVLCWNPTVQGGEGFGFTAGMFGFTIAGTTNIPIVIQACTNLSGARWTPVATNTLGTSGSLRFSDPDSTAPARFYRIAWPQ